MEIIYILLGSIFGIIGWIGNSLVTTLKEIRIDINEIKITIQDVSTSHDDLKDRVEKIESKVFNLNGK